MVANRSLTITEFSDRELLHLAVEEMDDDGWWTAEDVASKPELESIGSPRMKRSVMMRFIWLWKYDVLEREHVRDDEGRPLYIAGDPQRPKYGQRWRFTPLGRALMTGKLTKRQHDTLDKLGADGLVDLTRWVHQQARSGEGAAYNMVRREFRYGFAQRNGRR